VEGFIVSFSFCKYAGSEADALCSVLCANDLRVFIAYFVGK
jgi:hypothetical protein